MHAEIVGQPEWHRYRVLDLVHTAQHGRGEPRAGVDAADVRRCREGVARNQHPLDHELARGRQGHGEARKRNLLDIEHLAPLQGSHRTRKGQDVVASAQVLRGDGQAAATAVGAEEDVDRRDHQRAALALQAVRDDEVPDWPRRAILLQALEVSQILASPPPPTGAGQPASP
eukprot:CAMPEP_0168429742 /NCGR_PEP_ID=MMETSP0228-20121227/37526_1 /TAXON_ID=133427 /ORGANISM="Protoceratium reticulatum, Strain CCCM 535 (=CCMP 1889)" /LENGTH=171 /DNA_ID=CAMNT_0008443835 /DNA_START=22 /DNA_END=537 /DNA_ORIENTATION=+